jgi:hypothetical protein
MTQKVSNREARGVVTPAPDNSAPVGPAVPVDGPIGTISPSPMPQVQEPVDDIHSGRMTKFVPAIDFTGYPDGRSKTDYVKGVEAEAPANYVKLLRKQGRAA